jgi:ribose 5-phosphate isomerase B
MRIAIGADHRGFPAKEFLKQRLEEAGIEVIDCGSHNDVRSDHPIFAWRVARQIKEGKADRGVLVCGTGVGMEIAANKVPGIRAVLCFNREVTRLGRSHNDANVMTLPGDHYSPEQMWELVRVFLSTEFLGGRYAERVEMYHQLEEKGELDNGNDSCDGNDSCGGNQSCRAGEGRSS